MAVARYRVEIAGLVGGPGLSTFHADTTNGGYAAQDWVDAIEGLFNVLDAVTSSSITWTGQSVVDLLDVSTGQITGQTPVTPFTVVGTHNAEVLAPTTQGLITWRTGVYANGRQVVGKTFLPCPTIDLSQNPGVPVAGYVSGIQAGVDIYAAAGNGEAVYSRTHGLIPLITSGEVWNQWAVLRGRRDS